MDQVDNLNHKFIKVEAEDKNRGNYDTCNYDQQSYQNRYRSDSGDRRQDRQDRGRPRYEKNYRTGNFRGSVRNFDRQNSRGEYRNNYRMKVMTEAGMVLEKGHFPEAITTIHIRVKAIVCQGQDQEPV